MTELSEAEVTALREMIEKDKIYQNLVRYCRGMDRMDLALMQSTYWEDSHDNHGLFEGSGNEFCAAMYANHHLYETVSHHVSNTLIELKGNQAEVETYFVTAIGMKDPKVEHLNGGRYKDLYEKRGGEWKVLRRVVIWDWHIVQPRTKNLDLVNVKLTEENRSVFYPDDPIYKPW